MAEEVLIRIRVDDSELRRARQRMGTGTGEATGAAGAAAGASPAGAAIGAASGESAPLLMRPAPKAPPFNAAPLTMYGDTISYATDRGAELRGPLPRFFYNQPAGQPGGVAAIGGRLDDPTIPLWAKQGTRFDIVANTFRAPAMENAFWDARINKFRVSEIQQIIQSPISIVSPPTTGGGGTGGPGGTARIGFDPRNTIFATPKAPGGKMLPTPSAPSIPMSTWQSQAYDAVRDLGRGVSSGASAANDVRKSTASALRKMKLGGLQSVVPLTGVGLLMYANAASRRREEFVREYLETGQIPEGKSAGQFTETALGVVAGAVDIASNIFGTVITGLAHVAGYDEEEAAGVAVTVQSMINADRGAFSRVTGEAAREIRADTKKRDILFNRALEEARQGAVRLQRDVEIRLAQAGMVGDSYENIKNEVFPLSAAAIEEAAKEFEKQRPIPKRIAPASWLNIFGG